MSASYRPLELQARYRAERIWTGETLVARVAKHVEASPDALAVVDPADGRRVTYAQMWEDACTVAGFLRARGVEPGDVVSVQLSNRYDTVAVDMGVLVSGAVLNPLLPNYRERELRHILSTSRSRVLFTPMELRGFDHLGMARALTAEVPSLATLVTVGEGDPDGELHLSDVLRDHAPIPPVEVDAEARSEVIFTSGTEAQPKAIVHSEETVNSMVRAMLAAMGQKPSDVFWMPSPLGHSTGLNCGMRLAFYAGVPLVLQDQWDPAAATKLVESERCTYTLCATTFLADFVDELSRSPRDVSSLRVFGSVGAPVPPELVDRADSLGMEVLRLYGSTEAMALTWNRPDTPKEKKYNTDGPPLPGVELEVVDQDGKPVPAGTEGEIRARGPATCIGLFEDPEREAKMCSPDGWMYTGDLGVLDEDGYLTIVGRLKEIIIRGGAKIAPREIEDLLCEMPGIRAAAVIGLPDDRLGERTCACVVSERELSLDEVTAFLKDQGMATFKLPQVLRRVGEIPLTASGKQRKNALRDQILAESKS